jgi:hypothetical protein
VATTLGEQGRHPGRIAGVPTLGTDSSGGLAIETLPFPHRLFNVLDEHNQHVTVVKSVYHFVGVLLEAMRLLLSKLSLGEQCDGVVGSGVKSLPDPPVVSNRIVSLSFLIFLRLPHDQLAVKGTARELEDHFLHGEEL